MTRRNKWNLGFTEQFPLSVVVVVVEHDRRSESREVEFSTFVRLRLIREIAVLVVERKPRDVQRTVADRQLELAVPDARPVREDLHVVDAAARQFLFRAVALTTARKLVVHVHLFIY